jgi:hypothetical protein
MPAASLSGLSSSDSRLNKVATGTMFSHSPTLRLCRTLNLSLLLLCSLLLCRISVRSRGGSPEQKVNDSEKFDDAVTLYLSCPSALFILPFDAKKSIVDSNRCRRFQSADLRVSQSNSWGRRPALELMMILMIDGVFSLSAAATAGCTSCGCVT